MAVGGLAVGLVVAEAVVRIVRPKPAQQIVRGEGLHLLDGVPVWDHADDRYNRDCVAQHPERIRILFFGSSITFGTDLTAQEAFPTLLQVRLNELRPTPGFCVLNFAQPGFHFEQKYAVARVEVARYQPALIMWEDWFEWLDYHLLGDTAYVTAGLALRPDGFIGMEGVPDALNRTLFLHSRLYEYLALTLGEPADRPSEVEEVTAFASQRMVKLVALARAAGAKLVLYLAPPLDHPFAETAASPPEWHRILSDFARESKIASYPLERELSDQDYLALRLDPCCHYNAAGHRALVPVMERIVLQQLDGSAP